ncbi:MAG: DUF2845 domain-containing protein [Xanthomonadales bacterium]|nr:DUF2845 domain-containing protein [Xanthomonadales bacterium]
MTPPWTPLLVFVSLLLAAEGAAALDMQRCNGRVLKVGDWSTQAEALCGPPYFVERWDELQYVDLDARRSLRQRIDWSEAYFDPGEGQLLFRVRSRQGQIVAIDSLNRRGGRAQAGDCSLAALKRAQPIGEVVHRCGLPAQRIDLGAAVVDRRERIEEAQDLRHEQWLYPAGAGQTLVIELREGRALGAFLRP